MATESTQGNGAVVQAESPRSEKIDAPGRLNRGLALGGLALAVLATVGLLRLTDGDEAAPPDSTDSPDSPDDTTRSEPEEDDFVPRPSDVPVDVPVGAVVNLYPVDLPDDWSVTVFPSFVTAQPESLTLQPDVDGVLKNVSFEPGPEGDLHWTGEIDPTRPGWRDWAGRGWMGRIDDQMEGTFEDELDLLDALATAGLLDDPAGDVPTGWRVQGDTRSSVRGSQIEIETPDAATIQMTAVSFDQGSYTRAVIDQTMQEFLTAASEVNRELTAGGFPGWDGSLGWVSLYSDGWSYEIQMPDDLPAADRQTFLDSLRPVTVTERTNLELLGLLGTGPDGGDHWHAAYAIYVCDEFLDPFVSEHDPNGIHSHADGLIHIHPFNSAAQDSGATFATFLDAVAWDFEPGNIGARDGSVRFGDGSCGDGEMRTMLTYRAGTDRTSRPLEFEGDDMFDAFFPTDEGIWVLSHIPVSFRPPLIPEDRVTQLEMNTSPGG